MGFGFGIWDLRFGIWAWAFLVGILGFGLRIGSGSRVEGEGFRVLVSWSRIYSLRFRA